MFESKENKNKANGYVGLDDKNLIPLDLIPYSLPAQAGQSGHVLSTDGNNLQWVIAQTGPNGANGHQGIQGPAATMSLQQITNINNSTTNKITVGTANLQNILEYQNNTLAIANGLNVGDVYRLPYQG